MTQNPLRWPRMTRKGVGCVARLDSDRLWPVWRGGRGVWVSHPARPPPSGPARSASSRRALAEWGRIGRRDRLGQAQTTRTGFGLSGGVDRCGQARTVRVSPRGQNKLGCWTRELVRTRELFGPFGLRRCTSLSPWAAGQKSLGCWVRVSHWTKESRLLGARLSLDKGV